MPFDHIRLAELQILHPATLYGGCESQPKEGCESGENRRDLTDVARGSFTAFTQAAQCWPHNREKGIA
jgi:hypothetical protein